MSMTFNSLVAQVTAYLNRTDADTIDQIPNFIEQATQRICRESKNIGFEVYTGGNFIVGQAVYQKPGRWRRNIAFSYGTGANFNTFTPIQLRSYEFCRMYWPDATQVSPPLFYADYGYYNYIVLPTPDQTYPYEYAYLEKPVTITEVQQTNWITDNAPDVYLYATLLEAMPYLKNDERIPVWQQFYKMGIDSLNAQDDQRIQDRQTNRASD